MGLFDFFKKKPSENKQADRQQSEPIDNNSYLIDTLKNRLIELDYQVEKNPQYLALIVNDEIEIATVIIENPNNHPSILHLMILTIHPKYFPNGIKENIVGVGVTIEEKIKSVISNYIDTTFYPIIDSFTDSHSPDLDFIAIMNDKEVLWHPKLGNLTFQGQWNEHPQNETFFEIIKDKLSNKLTSNKINWLKLYISKRSDGAIIGECLFNNEHWEDGLNDITEYAESWKINGDFQGLKQFIVFRKCDIDDE
ncbi:DUF6348 family protein [Chryseobacterium indoltheticum]|uniref:DUF6348 family protein n=1 Tax=Chryseobacterium indoltheticum TaxID=254 RepID=UPI0040410194